MILNNLPSDINAEILLDHYPKGTFDVEFKGLHKRNAYMDVLDLENKGGCIQMSLGRKSLYNSLPEYLFHPIDRFDLPQYNRKERFAEEYVKQEQEISDAYEFFAPIDLALLYQRVKVRHRINELTSENEVLIDIISDTLSDNQKNNRFIKRSLPFLPYCKIIRGDRTLITLMLRKVLMDEEIVVKADNSVRCFSDCKPRYGTEVGSELSSLFVGESFEQGNSSYSVFYWSENDCDENFMGFIDELEEYRAFVQDFFFSVESILEFNVYNDATALRLSDTTTYNYLNYNTNI